MAGGDVVRIDRRPDAENAVEGPHDCRAGAHRRCGGRSRLARSLPSSGQSRRSDFIRVDVDDVERARGRRRLTWRSARWPMLLPGFRRLRRRARGCRRRAGRDRPSRDSAPVTPRLRAVEFHRERPASCVRAPPRAIDRGVAPRSAPPPAPSLYAPLAGWWWCSDRVPFRAFNSRRFSIAQRVITTNSMILVSTRHPGTSKLMAGSLDTARARGFRIACCGVHRTPDVGFASSHLG